MKNAIERIRNLYRKHISKNIRNAIWQFRHPIKRIENNISQRLLTEILEKFDDTNLYSDEIACIKNH